MSQNENELFDVVDDNDSVISCAPRWKVHQDGLFHRAIHLWIFNAQNEILLQKRSPTKDRFPNRWTSSVSGHVDAGENYQTTVYRESKEELGIDLNHSVEEIGYFPASHHTEEEFIKLYKIVYEGSLKPHAGEVSEVAWCSLQKLENWLKTTPEDFTPSFTYLWVSTNIKL